MIQYDMILYTTLQLLKHYINHGWYSQKALHTSHWQASYGMSIMRIFKKIYHIIKALHCIYRYNHSMLNIDRD